MIAAVFIRRLKPGATFEQFIAEWEADTGFGVNTRVINAQSLTDPRDIISIGFVDISPEEFRQWAAAPPKSEQLRHERIESVIESTTLKCQYEVRTEHDFTNEPREIELASLASLFAGFGPS